jgi:hypothetical protein
MTELYFKKKNMWVQTLLKELNIFYPKAANYDVIILVSNTCKQIYF